MYFCDTVTFTYLEYSVCLYVFVNTDRTGSVVMAVVCEKWTAKVCDAVFVAHVKLRLMCIRVERWCSMKASCDCLR